MNANKIAGLALVVMALGIVVIVVVAGNSPTTAVRSYFDNGLDTAVKIELDGKPAESIPAHSAALHESLAVGKHKVKVSDDKGQTLEEVDIEVPAGKGMGMARWVYNVGKKSEYKVRYVAYGNATPDKPQEVGEGQQFFQLPGSDPQFLPVEMPAEKGKGSLPVVGHKEVHPDWPCCKNLKALMTPNEKK